MKTNIDFKRYINNDPLQKKAFYLYRDGAKYFHLNDNLHREDGPAVEFPDGYKEWWLEGVCYEEDEQIYLIVLENYKKRKNNKK